MTRQNAIPVTQSSSNGEQNENGNSNDASMVKEIVQMPALIPFWDLANHADGTLTTIYNDTNGQIESTTFNDIKKGEQIFIHYGNRNNANLLVHNA